MNRSLRQSRFRRREDLAEDVNPSAYIVNLADCMLVLACGFMVAMMVYWNIDVGNIEELKKESLEEVDPESIIENIQSGGSYYIEAGTVYQDPNTGELWMVRITDENGEGGNNIENNTEPSNEGAGEEGEIASGETGSD